MEKQVINKEYLKLLLKEKNSSQTDLAAKMNENQKNLSRWLKDGFPRDKLLDLKRALAIPRESYRTLIGIPEYKIFFRTKYHGEVPEELKNKAIDWARVLIPTKVKTHDASFVDLSREEDYQKVATTIKNNLSLPCGCFFEQYISILKESGIEVVLIPFSVYGLKTDKERAFSVFNGKNRYVIFLDSDVNAQEIVWNLAHELCHLFRLNAEQGKKEESFCQNVAKEILYPTSYFKNNEIEINAALENERSAINMLLEIKDHFNGSSLSIALRLKEIFGKNQKIFNYLLAVGRNRESKNTITSQYFKNFHSSNEDEIEKFWNNLSSSSVYLRLFNRIKEKVSSDQMTTRKFSEIVDVELPTASSLVDKWRSEFDNLQA